MLPLSTGRISSFSVTGIEMINTVQLLMHNYTGCLTGSWHALHPWTFSRFESLSRTTASNAFVTSMCLWKNFKQNFLWTSVEWRRFNSFIHLFNHLFIQIVLKSATGAAVSVGGEKRKKLEMPHWLPLSLKDPVTGQKLLLKHLDRSGRWRWR